MKIPETLAWWRERSGGAAWLDRLPGIVDACVEQWSLELGEAFVGGNVALVVAAARDRTPVVLKVSFPDDESEHEADALVHWHGHGAVAVLERDDERRAMLLERVVPGTPLWAKEDDEDATRIAADVLGRLQRVPLEPTHGFRTLGDAAARWATTIPEDWRAARASYPARLVDVAVDACRTLGSSATSATLLHQDFHGGNVIRSEARGWLAIDPKPLAGDPAFDAASLLRDRRWLLGGAEDADRLRRRLDILVDALDLDRERMRLWGVVHALAWGVSGGKAEPDMLRCAELLASL